jgi:hypothetical protein
LSQRAQEDRCWESQDFYEHLVAHEVGEPPGDVWIPFSRPWSVLDQGGMLWPIRGIGGGRRGINVSECSRGQLALLSMRDARWAMNDRCGRYPH